LLHKVSAVSHASIVISWASISVSKIIMVRTGAFRQTQAFLKFALCNNSDAGILKLITREQEYDVCVVGAGPVGLAAALECEASGLSVLLIDAGQARSQKLADDLCEAEISDFSRHVSLDIATRSGFGGTSEVWGGRCVPFDDIDFERRPFVPHSGWTISHDEMKPWYAKAASYLGCGAGGFISSLADWDQGTEISCKSIERLSSQPRLGQRFKSKLTDSRRLRVRLGEAVHGIDLDSEGTSVRSLRLASSGSRPVARSFILACGGLQTTRILLDLQRTMPGFFGGETGPLGRFYMGHLTGRIASLVLHDPGAIENFDYNLDEDGYWYRRRFSLSAATQRKNELLNTVFWLGNPPFHDESHGSAAASSIYLSLSLPIARTKYFSRDFVSFHRGDEPLNFRKHLANILRDPKDAARGLASAVGYQLSRDKLKPFFVRNSRGCYSLYYHSEQIPDASNRIRLIRDSGGCARIAIDFRYCEQDAQSIVRAHEVLDRELRETGKGYVKYWQRPEERLDHVLAQARDGYHQIGTARMNENERLGIVDGDCRVHGLKNLYVAGSTVFPTSGQANPTFMAVALSTRLAGQLSNRSTAA
jgi:GMC oxidoreductase/FAD binding domain-containing protein